MLQSSEETVEVVKAALQERISERSEAIKVPNISRQRSVEVVKTTSQERMSFRSGSLRGCVTRSAENICSVTSSCGSLDAR